jgi:hypothetical protein
LQGANEGAATVKGIVDDIVAATPGTNPIGRRFGAAPRLACPPGRRRGHVSQDLANAAEGGA